MFDNTCSCTSDAPKTSPPVTVHEKQHRERCLLTECGGTSQTEYRIQRFVATTSGEGETLILID